MKCVQKQSQKAGCVVTKEIQLGVDGPLTINLKDTIQMNDESGKNVQIPASRVLGLFADCQYTDQVLKQLFNDVITDIKKLQLQVQQLEQQLQQAQTVTQCSCSCNAPVKQDIQESVIQQQEPILNSLINPEPVLIKQIGLQQEQKESIPELAVQLQQIVQTIDQQVSEDSASKTTQEQEPFTPIYKEQSPAVQKEVVIEKVAEAPKKPTQRGRTKKQ